MAETITAKGTGRMTRKVLFINQLSNDQKQTSGVGSISIFSRRQQRKMKLFLLKASRPILKMSRNKTDGSAALGTLTGLSDSREDSWQEPEQDLKDMPLMALEAYEEARRRQIISGKAGKPLDSALEAVDWMLDLAQGMQYDWPMFAWMKENEKAQNAPSGDILLRVSLTSTSQETEAIYPRCAWPRKSLEAPALSTDISSINVVEELSVSPASSEAPESLVYPRCTWPRKTSKKLPEAITCTSTENTFARCEWPRRLVEKLPGSSQVVVLERIFASDSNVGYPQCPWPRKEKIPTRTSEAYEEGMTPEGPRCAWPRRSSYL